MELRKTKKFLTDNFEGEKRKSEQDILRELRKLKRHGGVLAIRVACDCCE